MTLNLNPNPKQGGQMSVMVFFVERGQVYGGSNRPVAAQTRRRERERERERESSAMGHVG